MPIELQQQQQLYIQCEKEQGLLILEDLDPGRVSYG
jgi:hypothetical protein